MFFKEFFVCFLSLSVTFGDDGGALSYSESDFDDKISGLPHFIKFFAPWLVQSLVMHSVEPVPGTSVKMPVNYHRLGHSFYKKVWPLQKNGSCLGRARKKIQYRR